MDGFCTFLVNIFDIREPTWRNGKVSPASVAKGGGEAVEEAGRDGRAGTWAKAETQTSVDRQVGKHFSSSRSKSYFEKSLT